MNNILQNINNSKRSLGILIDPEKMGDDEVSAFAKAVPQTISSLKEKLSIDYCCLLVGGSTMKGVDINHWVEKLKKQVDLPIILFPGSPDQLTEAADGLLFLSLLSGRNPAYLIDHQVEAAKRLTETQLEVIPTSYLLIDGGHTSAVERTTGTTPMSQKDPEVVATTAYAGQLMGHELVYLEAGSGAIHPVSSQIIRMTSDSINIPVIVGGGLRKIQDMQKAYEAGASMLVVGTAIEEDPDWKG